MDRLARELKLDRAELRRRNLIPAGEDALHQAAQGALRRQHVQYDSGDYPACQADGARPQPAGTTFRAGRRQARASGRYIGIGPRARHQGHRPRPVRIRPGAGVADRARVSVFTGAAAIGQGLRTALAQICAERARPPAAGHHRRAGRHLGRIARARRLRQPADRHRRQLRAAGGARRRRQGQEAREPCARSRRARSRARRRRGARRRRAASFRSSSASCRASCRARPATASRPASSPGSRPAGNFRTDALAYANACHVAEVEVDIETGEVRILRYHALQDSGTLINPMMVDGQVHGGIAHGIGNALFEWMGYDDAAQPVTTTFADYLLPTATELPMLDDPLQANPLPAQSARREGRRRGQHHPGGGGDRFRDRGRAHAVRRAHRPGSHHAVRACGADRGRAPGGRALIQLMNWRIHIVIAGLVRP